MVHVNELQDAVEAVTWQWRTRPQGLSELLAERAPALAEALERLTATGDSDHMPAPVLEADERAPETVQDDEAIFDAIFDDDRPQRHLSDVWNGQGDHNDPLVPEDSHEHELVLQRLREATPE